MTNSMDAEQYRRSCCIPPSEEEWAEFCLRFRDLWSPNDGVKSSPKPLYYYTGDYAFGYPPNEESLYDSKIELPPSGY